MSQVGGTNHPRKIYSIQLHWSRIHWFHHLATDAGSADAGTEEAGSAPCLSSETQENDENINNDGNNSNDDDFPDLNISYSSGQANTSLAPSQHQSKPNFWKDLFLLQLIYFLASLTGSSQISTQMVFVLFLVLLNKFSQDHLQQHGLLNDGNICSLISLLLSLFSQQEMKLIRQNQF